MKLDIELKPTEKRQLEVYKAAIEVLASKESLTKPDAKGRLSCEAELKARIDYANEIMTDTFNDGA